MAYKLDFKNWPLKIIMILYKYILLIHFIMGWFDQMGMTWQLASSEKNNEVALDSVKIETIDVDSSEVDLTQIKKVEKPSGFIAPNGQFIATPSLLDKNKTNWLFTSEQVARASQNQLAFEITMEDLMLIKKLVGTDITVLSRLNVQTNNYDDIAYTDTEDDYKWIIKYVEGIVWKSIETKKTQKKLSDLNSELIAGKDYLDDETYSYEEPDDGKAEWEEDNSWDKKEDPEIDPSKTMIADTVKPSNNLYWPNYLWINERDFKMTDPSDYLEKEQINVQAMVANLRAKKYRRK